MTRNFHFGMEHIKAASNKFRRLMKENIHEYHFHNSSFFNK